MAGSSFKLSEGTPVSVLVSQKPGAGRGRCLVQQTGGPAGLAARATCSTVQGAGLGLVHSCHVLKSLIVEEGAFPFHFAVSFKPTYPFTEAGKMCSLSESYSEHICKISKFL